MAADVLRLYEVPVLLLKFFVGSLNLLIAVVLLDLL